MKLEIYTVKSIKAYLKKLSVLIKIAKQLRKLPENQNLSPYDVDLVNEANTKLACSWSEEARHFHIAYCEFRGTPRSLIEPKTDNPPNETYITNILKKMYEDTQKTMVVINA